MGAAVQGRPEVDYPDRIRLRPDGVRPARDAGPAAVWNAVASTLRRYGGGWRSGRGPWTARGQGSHLGFQSHARPQRRDCEWPGKSPLSQPLERVGYGLVGRTPWSAADAPVGLLAPAKTRRDGGVP